MKADTQRERAERFWSWFLTKAGNAVTHGRVDFRVLNEVVDRLQRVHPHLVCEFGAGSDCPAELVISADGIRANFPAVRALVDAAPEIPGWKVVAFRQPRDIVGPVSLGGIAVRPDDVWFSFTAEREVVQLRMYFRGYRETRINEYAGLTFLLLDAALGEYTVATRIGRLEWAALPPDPEVRGLLPYCRLRGLMADVHQLRPQSGDA